MPCHSLGQQHGMPKPWPAARHAPALASLSCHGHGQQRAMPRPWPAACHATTLASSLPCPGLGQHVMPRPWPAACHATALASNMACRGLGRQHAMPRPLPAAWQAQALVSSSMPCQRLGQQHALPRPRPAAWHATPRPRPSACLATALSSSMACPALASSMSCHGLGTNAKPRPWQACHVPRVIVQVALRNACPSVKLPFGWLWRANELPVLSLWKLVARSMSLESCLLRLFFAFALTGACSASLNVFARSSGFLVLRGVIRFGGLVHSVRRGA